MFQVGEDEVLVVHSVAFYVYKSIGIECGSLGVPGGAP